MLKVFFSPQCHISLFEKEKPIMCCLWRNRILEYDAQGVEVSRPAFGHGWQCARTHGCLHHLHLPAFGNFKDKNIFGQFCVSDGTKFGLLSGTCLPPHLSGGGDEHHRKDLLGLGD